METFQLCLLLLDFNILYCKKILKFIARKIGQYLAVSLSPITKTYILEIDLFTQKAKLQREREKERREGERGGNSKKNLHLLIHSPNDHSGQG